MAVVHLTNALIRSVCEEQGFGTPKPGVLHVLAIRDAQPAGATSINIGATPKPDRWDDTLGCFGTALEVFPGTTDPGKYHSQHPSDPQGAAWLIPGKWAYKKGKHKGLVALVQAGEVTVRRDRDRDSRPEYGEPLDTGWFGINCHRGGKSSLPVGKWSAGCMVIPEDFWPGFWKQISASKQQNFDLWLLRAAWFA